ncbi:hypothetical protein ACIBAG_07545 [Streptomyces sp. NPDC051243]|uniref:hypothetical protein n=1 Tax=Streptomyces sp. NPDC051243 TaxID=3365646 RepID=UPI0037996864
MISVMVGSRVQRPVPSVLLIGLILLVASHLVGALHGPGFLGSHQPFSAVGVVQSAAPVEAEAIGSGHGHDHGHDRDHEVHEDTVEHAVDRVRSSVDGPAHAPQIEEPATGLLAASAPLGHAAGPGVGVPDPAGGRSACALHCVWRQ